MADVRKTHSFCAGLCQIKVIHIISVAQVHTAVLSVKMLFTVDGFEQCHGPLHFPVELEVVWTVTV